MSLGGNVGFVCWLVSGLCYLILCVFGFTDGCGVGFCFWPLLLLRDCWVWVCWFGRGVLIVWCFNCVWRFLLVVVLWFWLGVVSWLMFVVGVIGSGLLCAFCFVLVCLLVCLFVCVCLR